MKIYANLLDRGSLKAFPSMEITMTIFLSACIAFFALLLVYIEMRLIVFQSMFYKWLEIAFSCQTNQTKQIMKEFLSIKAIDADDDKTENLDMPLSFNTASLMLIRVSIIILAILLAYSFAATLSSWIKHLKNFAKSFIDYIDSPYITYIWNLVVDYFYLPLVAISPHIAILATLASAIYLIQFFHKTSPFCLTKLDEKLKLRVESELAKKEIGQKEITQYNS